MPSNKPKIEDKLGVVEVTTGLDTLMRSVIMLWGEAGVGKTTFAATMPGDKLWLSMGDNEHVSVQSRKDVYVAKLYDLTLETFFRQGQGDDPFGLDKYLSEHENVVSVVCDSLTALAFRALQKAVKIDKCGASNKFTPSMETPGLSAYGARNAIVFEVLTGLLRVTAKHNVHILITAHEDDPTMVEGQDVIDYVGVMLGGKIVTNAAWRLSEIWYMWQERTGNKEMRLAFRPTRKRKPMKTRMFRTDDAPDFILQYTPYKSDDAPGQMTIASWLEELEKTGGHKLALPVAKEAKKVVKK